VICCPQKWRIWRGTGRKKKEEAVMAETRKDEAVMVEKGKRGGCNGGNK